MAQILKISTHGLKVLMNLEGVKDSVYSDVAGIPTVGVGHALTKSERSSGKIYLTNGDVLDVRNPLTHAEIMNLLLDDVARFEDAVTRNVKVKLEQHQFDALVSFSFNVGERAFEKSTLLKLLNNGEYEKAGEQFKRWDKASVKGRKVSVKGLTARRAIELALWNGQNPSGNLDQQESRPDEYVTDNTGETLPIWHGNSTAGAMIASEEPPQSQEMIDFLQWRKDLENSKPTSNSKIIGTAGAMIASAILTRYGLDLPAETVTDVLTGLLVGGASLIAYFRRYRTDKAFLR